MPLAPRGAGYVPGCTYVTEPVKLPWHIDLLDVNLDNHDLKEAERLTLLLAAACGGVGTRVAENLDSEGAPA